MNSSYHLSLSVGSQSYDVNLAQTDRPELTSLFIGGRSYAVVGDPTVSSLVKDRLSKLPSKEFETIESFSASFLEGKEEVQKIHRVAIEQLGADRVQNVEKIDSYLQKAVEEKNFRGRVAIVLDGKLLLSKGYGVANETGEEITDKTIFHLGSLTKQFTAAAIMLLQQKGLLDTKDPVSKHLPEKYAHNPKWEKVTIHQLLNHSSGIPNYGPDEVDTKELTLDDVIGGFYDKELRFEPGTAWNYSNGGYALLGAIIEHISHQPYGDFVQKEIFDRLDMSSSGFGKTYSMDKAALGYKKKEGGNTLEPVVDQAAHLAKAHAAGGLYSTVGDMQRWITALDNDSFLFPESRELMFGSKGLPAHEPTPGTTEHPVMNYGYGFFISDEPSMGKTISHDAGIPGFSNFVLKFPGKKTSIIVLSNLYEFNTPEMGFSLLDMLVPHKKDF